ncbi:tetratricopeptide repeat protein [Actinoplanes derwentensis]|uniref:DNA-binding transcriptional activator of the SARP family n=1 Tax=Actinoplanes derwentensis TaxID=113562 RepID=A0A1H2ATW9_9ACTN|nr:tetratricopeptide repeat protein [Actinoplanes derwentensis]GID84312.1 SARP family transcriptional regulator [Actinoplanes derwentensis]SDT49460.1 DNA-binding transcriptional activator of the SARP family [Actinoplanes derwentensis]
MTQTGNASGYVLRQRRILLGLTQEDLALRAGVSVRSVRNLERGAGGVPRQQTLRQLAAAVGLDDLGGGGTAAAGIRVAVLGPLTVHDCDREVPIGSAMQRRLLGLLGLHPGQPVRTADLVDVLWDGRPPATHVNLIHGYVGALRKILGPSVVVTGPDGYRLALDRDRIDLARFGDLMTRAEHGAEDYERALQCWRGPIDPAIRLHPAAVAAANLRIVATLAFADQAIATRRYDAAIRWLGPLSQEEPLHEGLHARLVLALAGSGRQAEALRHFAAVRDRIVQELGVEPGPQLTEAHLGVLRQELPGAAVRKTTGVIPAELPSATAFLAGRDPALQSLNRLLTDSAPAIAAISGGPGTGKTTLAVHWAHAVRDRFPDGQLFVNLRGFDPAGAVVPADRAIRTFLESLGVEPQKIPPGLDGQVNLYRSLLAARRVLVVLDNARDAEHVRPLLPGSAGSAAVVTSRNRLTGLIVVDGGTSVSLSVLHPEEAYALLSRRIGVDRAAAEPDAVAEIGRLCGHLPLALAIVAARAVQAELPLSWFVVNLRAERARLDVLGGDEAAIDVRGIFSWSYRVLSPAAARLFRLLGSHPGTDLGAGAAASMAGRPVEQVREPLGELVRGSLIEEESDGRYTMHDLLRVYALETAAEVDTAADREAAIRRMAGYYVAGAIGAGQILDPHRMTDRLGRPPVEPAAFESTDAAAVWLTVERQNLLAVQLTAADAGLDDGAWWLAWGLAEYLQRGGHWQDWMATQRVALEAAHRLGDVYRETIADRGLGGAYARLGDFEKATPCFQRVLARYEQSGDLSEAASAHLSLGWVAGRRQDFSTALHHARQALALSRAVGNTRGEADGLNTVGWYLIQLGEHQSALVQCRQALALHREVGNRLGMADTWDTLGSVHHRLGEHQPALAAYREALAFYVEVLDRYHEALVLNQIGDTHRAAGDLPAARESWQQALWIFDDRGHAEAAEVREKLDSLS